MSEQSNEHNNDTKIDDKQNRHYIGHEFEIIKYRHEDQVKLLHGMTLIDLQLFSGYLTIQLAFGSFLIQQQINSLYLKFGLIFVEISVALLCFILLRYNYLRRKEVVGTLKNCNEALGLTEIGAILKDKAINSTTKFRPWFHWYSLGIILSFVGICIIIFAPENKSSTTSKKGAKTEIKIEILDTIPVTPLKEIEDKIPIK